MVAWLVEENGRTLDEWSVSVIAESNSSESNRTDQMNTQEQP